MLTPGFIQAAMTGGTSDTVSFAELEGRALAFEREKRLDEARDAFDAALRIEPGSQSAAEGRARIALQLREENAAEHCARALAFRDDDPAMQAQMIAVAMDVIGVAAIPLLETYVAAHPDHVGAQERIADLRAQAGAGDAFADGFLEALSRQPANKPLMMSYWSTLSRTGRYEQAMGLMEANRSLFEGARDFAMLEIGIASHSGMIERASDL